jgi:hypothetical protein
MWPRGKDKASAAKLDSGRRVVGAFAAGVVAAVALMVAAAGVTWAQMRADSPGAVLKTRHREIAACVTAPGAVRLLIRLFLDGDAKVKKVEVDANVTLSKKARTCVSTRVADLQFSVGLAGRVLEHELTIVNSGQKP